MATSELVEDGYGYCVGGTVYLVCQRCGGLVCGEAESMDVHESFHDALARRGVKAVPDGH